MPAHGLSMPVHGLSLPVHGLSLPVHGLSLPVHGLSLPELSKSATSLREWAHRGAVAARELAAAACDHEGALRVHLAGRGGEMLPARWCLACASVRTDDRRHHALADDRIPDRPEEFHPQAGLTAALREREEETGEVLKSASPPGPPKAGAAPGGGKPGGDGPGGGKPGAAPTAPSGHVAASCYADPKSCDLRWITAHPDGDAKGVPLLVHDNGEEYTVVGGAGGRMNQLVFHHDPENKKKLMEARHARAEERKAAAAAARGPEGQHLWEQKKKIAAEAKKQNADLTNRALKTLGAQFGGDALAGLSREAEAKARQEAPAGAKPEEIEALATAAAERAAAEAREVTRRLVSHALDHAAMREIGGENERGEVPDSQFEATLGGRHLVKKMTPAEEDAFVTHAASAAALAAKAKALARVLNSGDLRAAQGILATIEPMTDEEARARNVQRYLDGESVNANAALVRESLLASPVSQRRDQGAGASDALNAIVQDASPGGKGTAILTPDLVRSLGVEKAAQVAAAYLRRTAGAGQAGAIGASLEKRIASQSGASAAAALASVRDMDALAGQTREAARGDDWTVTAGQAANVGMRLAEEKYKLLNVARGENRAAAALAYSLRGPATTGLSLPGGTTQAEADARAAGLGLAPGAYTVRSEGGKVMIDVPAAHVADLARPTPGAEAARAAHMDELRGQVADRPGAWKPEGFNSAFGLYPHQELAVRALLDNKKVLLNYGAGSGKNNVYLAAAADALSRGLVDKVLISMPAKPRSQQLGPKGEATRFLAPDMAARCAVVDGEQSLTKALADVRAGTKSIIFVSPDVLRDHQKELMDAGFGAKHTMFCADEAHEFETGQGEKASGIAKAARAFTAGAEYATWGTGTLIDNDAKELASAIEAVEPGALGDVKQFTDRWERLSHDGGMLTPDAREALRRQMSGLMLSYDKPVVDRGTGRPVALHRNVVRVPLAPEQREAIRAINEAYLKEKSSPDEAVAKAAALRRDAREQQVLDFGAPGKDGKIVSPKLDKLRELIAAEKRGDPSAKVGVYARNLAPLEEAGSRLTTGDGPLHSVVSVTGAQNDQETRAAMGQINDPRSSVDGALLSDAATYGINGQGLRHIYKLHPLLTAGKDEQLDHRHYRNGQTHDVYSTTLLSEHPLDEMGQYRVADEKGAQMALLASMSDTSGASHVLARHMATIERAAAGGKQ